MKTAHGDPTEKEKKDKAAMKESLMLPCTSAGKTTSASIAERSNVWAENRLAQKKSVLDKKLYKSIVKMNTDKLEIVHELSKLKKSASTGALERMTKAKEEQHSQQSGTESSSIVKSSSKTSLSSTSSKKASDVTLTPNAGRQTRSETLLKHTDSKAKISITIGGDSSSEEESEEERGEKNHTHEHKHTLSLTSCPFGRDCSANRSELRKFENATKRYSRELSAKGRNGK